MAITLTEQEFKNEKKKIIKAAQDLHYPPEVIKKLRAAETPAQLNNIMKTAREKS